MDRHNHSKLFGLEFEEFLDDLIGVIEDMFVLAELQLLKAS